MAPTLNPQWTREAWASGAPDCPPGLHPGSTIGVVSTLVDQPARVPNRWRPPALHLPDGGSVSHGEVFTRRWVVDLILDLAGYTPDRDLAAMRAIEPACGAGAFLVPMAARLAESCRVHGRPIADAAEAMYAVDLMAENVAVARSAVVATLVDDGWDEDVVRCLSDGWVHADDFLLGQDVRSTADFVLGNPPYVRLEEVSDARSAAYRRACPTMSGRADLFVGFYEVGLRALKRDGTLAFICADRWMHNAYGRSLRSLIGDHFSVEVIVVMHDVDAFDEAVSAYPAISVIRRKDQGRAVLADTTSEFGPGDAGQLLRWTRGLRRRAKHTGAFQVAELPYWHNGPEAWPARSPDRLALIADLERRFPRLEDPDTGTRVGIGVATGADGVFVTSDADLVEAERLLPLAMVRDTKTGHFDWSGHFLVDPWDDGPGTGLVDLDQYPRLRTYFGAREGQLRRRHIAERRQRDWYRTIDRVDHALRSRPKLLFPDMKMAMEPVYEPGGSYPHHNLYYVVSDVWPLDVLGGLLLSRIADLFVRTYAVKMRGGTLRFQAQYMRRICVPKLEAIRKSDQAALAQAFEARDVDKATGVAQALYGLDSEAISVIR